MLSASFYVVLGFAASAVLLGWAYFRRYEITRPPVGVLGLGDVAFMVGVIILIPYLYLALPSWLVWGIIALGMFSILYFTAEPVFRSRWALWLVALAVWGADIWIRLRFGAGGAPFYVANNVVLVVAIAGTANLWAQGGMKARDVAVLAGVLAVYDVIATSVLPLTTDLSARLAGMPFAPLVAWNSGADRLAIGLGDLLLATTFPLVMRKAFGRPAGLAAIVIVLVTIAAVMAFMQLADVRVTLPAMTLLGPLMVLQYVYWIRRMGRERTTIQYLHAEPPSRRAFGWGH